MLMLRKGWGMLTAVTKLKGQERIRSPLFLPPSRQIPLGTMVSSAVMASFRYQVLSSQGSLLRFPSVQHFTSAQNPLYSFLSLGSILFSKILVFLVSVGLKSLLQKVLFQLSRKALKTLLKLYASENAGRENAGGKPRCEKRRGGMEESEIKEQRRQKNKLSSVTNSSAIYKAFTLSPREIKKC